MLCTNKDIKNIQDWLWQSNFTLCHPFWVTLKDEDSLGAVPDGIKIRPRGQREGLSYSFLQRKFTQCVIFVGSAPDFSDLLDLLLRSKGVSWKQESPVTGFSLSIYLQRSLSLSYTFCITIPGWNLFFLFFKAFGWLLCLSSSAILVLSSTL